MPMLPFREIFARIIRGGMGAVVALVIIGCTAAEPAVAQATAWQERATVDSLARAFEANQKIPGLVVGTVDSSGRRAFRYGVASIEDSVRLRSSTCFEIGSVTKLFTALLLAEMVQRDTVDLTDPIGRYLPDSVHVPAFEGQPIELRHLATHTSGLPRLPDNFTPSNPADPYADYTVRELYAFLDGVELSRSPGARYAYSNVGGGLLGHLVARQADTSYVALLRTRVLRPLDLEDTGLPAASNRPGEEHAIGYGMTGRAAYWHWDVLAGAGALHSTPDDLLRFLQLQLRPEKTSLAAAIRLTHEIRHRSSDQQAVALGWHVTTTSDGTRTYWHNGGTGGFRSFVGFVPAEEIALVVLANKAVSLQPFNQFAFRLLRILR